MTRARWILIGAVGIAACAVGGWWFFLRTEAPPRASIDRAATAVDDAANPSAPAGSIAGIWTVNPNEGQSEGGSYGGYRVDEVLARTGQNTVAGRSSNATGTVVLSESALQSVAIEVELEELKTDNPRRDGRALDALETDRFPKATFESRAAVEFGEVAENKTISVSVPGTFTIHGVKKDETVTLDARRVGSTIVLVGTVPITFADFEIELPSAPVVVSLEEDGLIEFQLFLTKT